MEPSVINEVKFSNPKTNNILICKKQLKSNSSLTFGNNKSDIFANSNNMNTKQKTKLSFGFLNSFTQKINFGQNNPEKELIKAEYQSAWEKIKHNPIVDEKMVEDIEFSLSKNKFIATKQLYLADKLIEKNPDITSNAMSNLLCNISIQDDKKDIVLMHISWADEQLEKKPNISAKMISAVFTEMSPAKETAQMRLTWATNTLEKYPNISPDTMSALMFHLDNKNIRVLKQQLKCADKLLEKYPDCTPQMMTAIYYIREDKKTSDLQMELFDYCLDKDIKLLGFISQVNDTTDGFVQKVMELDNLPTNHLENILNNLENLKTSELALDIALKYPEETKKTDIVEVAKSSLHFHKPNAKTIKQISILAEKGFTEKEIPIIIHSLKQPVRNNNSFNVIKTELNKLKLPLSQKMLEDIDTFSTINNSNPAYAQHFALINNLEAKDVTSNYGNKFKKILLDYIKNISKEDEKKLAQKNINKQDLINKLSQNFTKYIDKTQHQHTKPSNLRTSKNALSQDEKYLVEQFSLPIEIWEDKEKLNQFAAQQAKAIIEKDYPIMNYPQAVEDLRKQILSQWASSNIENPIQRLMIFKAITSNLGNRTANLPPIYDENILKNVLKTIKLGQSFVKVYNKALAPSILRDNFFEEVDVNGIKGVWIKLPSMKNDPENFRINVDKLKILSLDTWCTKSYEASNHIEQGDFYIFRTNDNTELGVSFLRDSIDDIEGYANTHRIPLAYLEVVQKFISDHNFPLTENALKELNIATQEKIQYDELKNDITKLMAEQKYKNIFEKLLIDVSDRPNGKIAIRQYDTPKYNFRIKDLGIDEKALFSIVEEINNIELENTTIKNIRHIKKLNGIDIPWNELEK